MSTLVQSEMVYRSRKLPPRATCYGYSRRYFYSFDFRIYRKNAPHEAGHRYAMKNPSSFPQKARIWPPAPASEAYPSIPDTNRFQGDSRVLGQPHSVPWKNKSSVCRIRFLGQEPMYAERSAGDRHTLWRIANPFRSDRVPPHDREAARIDGRS